MKVYRDLEKIKFEKGTVLTTGTFDGVHFGHQKVLGSLTSSAKKSGLESVLLTFDPHPRIVLEQDTDLKLLSTLNEKLTLLEGFGIDHVVVIPFTKEFSRLSSIDFVRQLLVGKLNTKKLILGYDHHFGRNREGSFEHLLEFGPLYGFEVEEIPVQDVDNVNVSSTKIRTAIKEGEVAYAAELMGHLYELSGKVVNGNKIGAGLGFPTANVAVENPYKLLPKNGVYFVQVVVGNEKHFGMLNIGFRPTFEQEMKQTIEVHLFDFDEDLYGKQITLLFKEHIRNEISFENTVALISQLQADELICRKLV